MFQSVLHALKDQFADIRGRNIARMSPGLLGSLLLHGAALLFIVLLFLRNSQQIVQHQSPFLPVDVIPLGDQTSAPPAPLHSAVPQQRASRGPQGAPRPQGVSPHGTKPLPDELEMKLKNLSKLRAPDSDLKIENDGTSDVTASNGGAPGNAAYAVKDYIRAQVLRRWSLDLAKLGSRHFTIALHVQISGRGFVTDVQFADPARFKTDALYRDIAISARNAVLLSSPIKLPDGQFANGLDVTLDLNPRDTQR